MLTSFIETVSSQTPFLYVKKWQILKFFADVCTSIAKSKQKIQKIFFHFFVPQGVPNKYTKRDRERSRVTEQNFFLCEVHF